MAIGLALFAISSGLCGIATSSLMLNTARALQGCGGALLCSTAALAIISNTFTGDANGQEPSPFGSLPYIALTSVRPASRRAGMNNGASTLALDFLCERARLCCAHLRHICRHTGVTRSGQAETPDVQGHFSLSVRRFSCLYGL